MSLTKLSSSGFEEKSGFSARTYRKQGKVSMNYHSILKGKKPLSPTKLSCASGDGGGAVAEKRGALVKYMEKNKQTNPVGTVEKESGPSDPGPMKGYLEPPSWSRDLRAVLWARVPAYPAVHGAGFCSLSHLRAGADSPERRPASFPPGHSRGPSKPLSPILVQVAAGGGKGQAPD